MTDAAFQFQHYRLGLKPAGILEMPRYNKGNVIRGGFGGTFRRIVCHASCREPETCELRSVCPYVAVFNPFVPEGSEKISRNRDIPRPFVLKPPLEPQETYQEGELLSFDLVVVGRAMEYLPYFIVTFKELCQTGLGRRRTLCELDAVESLSAAGLSSLVYGGADNTVRPPERAIDWTELNHAGKVSVLKLRFLTPASLKADGRVMQRPLFASILRRLRDRINALAYFYCGHGLEIDFKALGQEAEKIALAEDRTRWVESARYSRRRAVTHDLSGFVGEAVFTGNLTPFIPYLRLGEFLHVGKNAVFGNGWYRIEEMR